MFIASRNINILIYALAFMYTILACANDSNYNMESAEALPDSLEAYHKIPRAASYYQIKVNDSFLKAIKQPHQKNLLRVLQVINRKDWQHFKKKDSLVLPDTIIENINYYSPFPDSISMFHAIPKILLISKKIQAFAAYEQGRLMRWGAISTGKKKSPTPNGLFYTNWKAKKTISTVNPEWIMEWYFNFDNKNGISMHEYAMPGFPASHSCIRMLTDDAFWIYYWADQWLLDEKGKFILKNGTPLVIFGDYDFHLPPPWYQLPLNPLSNNFAEDSLKSNLKPYLNDLRP